MTSLSPVTTVSSGLTTVAGRLEAIVEDLVLRPAGVAITKDGRLAVSDELSRTVRFFHNNGCEVSLARRWPERVFGTPAGMAVVKSTGNVVVADASRRIVMVK